MLATLRTGVASKGMNALKSSSSIATRSFSNSNSASAISTLLESMSPEDRLVYGEPLQIPPTHNITVAHLHLRSYLPQQLEFFTDFARRAAAALDMPCTGAIPLPVQTSKWTINKSPFVYKKAQETFERKTHKRLLAIRDANPEVVRRWVQFLNQNSMAGVGMRITTWEHAELGAGQQRLEKVQKGEVRNRSVAELMKNVEGVADVEGMSSNADQEPSKEVKAVADQLLAEMMKDIGGEEEIVKDTKKDEQSTTETVTPSPEVVAVPEIPEQPAESPIADVVEPLVSGSSTMDPELSKIVEKAIAETATQSKKD